MFDADQLAGFTAAAAILVLLPGPNTLVILASALAGRAAGLAAVAGVELGTMVHTLAVAIGMAALLAASDVAFAVVKYAGVTYLLFTGVKTLLEAAPDEVDLRPLPRLLAFRRALLTNLLNPKSAVFFLAFLPQFVHPERGHLFVQFVALGAIVSAIGICVGTLLVLAASSLAGWLRAHASFGRWQRRVSGVILIAVAVIAGLARR